LRNICNVWGKLLPLQGNVLLSISNVVSYELLTTNAKRFLVIECALFSILAATLVAVMFSRNYTFHFEAVTLNYYTNGSSDFTTNVAGLVRSLGTVAVLSLFFGVTTGAAIGLTCSAQPKTPNSASDLNWYEEEVARLGFVVVNKTDQGTTYELTDLGRRFLRDYRFLEKTENATI